MWCYKDIDDFKKEYQKRMFQFQCGAIKTQTFGK